MAWPPSIPGTNGTGRVRRPRRRADGLQGGALRRRSVRPRRVLERVPRQADGEMAPGWTRALCVNAPALCFDRPARDRQPEAGAGLVGATALERLEDRAELLG